MFREHNINTNKVKLQELCVVNPNLGGIFRGSFRGWGEGKITSCLKLVRTMLET